MRTVPLESTPYHERLIFVWLAAGLHGEPEAAFAIDGRVYPDARQARAALIAALEQTDERVRVEEFRAVRITENEKELDYWPSWAEFQGFLDVYGPVYPWRRPQPRPTPQAPPVLPAAPPKTTRPPSYSDLHYECWGQLLELFPPGQGPYDPVTGRQARGYGLNGRTGEFEADTRRVVQLANGGEDDETWPMRDEDEFVAAVEARRARIVETSSYQRRDKPEIAAAYARGQAGRATYEMWREVHSRRAYFTVGDEPVRVDLAADGTPSRVWRVDRQTGKLVAAGKAEARAALLSGGKRVTEHAWILAVESLRLGLAPEVVGPTLAEAYDRARVVTDDVYRGLALTDTFDLWAETFAEEAGQ